MCRLAARSTGQSRRRPSPHLDLAHREGQRGEEVEDRLVRRRREEEEAREAIAARRVYLVAEDDVAKGD
jgi:hypothetical protein